MGSRCLHIRPIKGDSLYTSQCTGYKEVVAYLLTFGPAFCCMHHHDDSNFSGKLPRRHGYQALEDSLLTCSLILHNLETKKYYSPTTPSIIWSSERITASLSATISAEPKFSTKSVA